MTLEQRVESLEKEVATLKDVLTSLSEQISYINISKQSSIDDIRARLDAMSLPSP